MSLRGLYQSLKAEIHGLTERNPGKPVCLVLDDFSVLMSLGVRTEEVISFVRYCERLQKKV